MPRNIYGPEHEDFRASVREFVERTLKPRAEQMLEVKAIDRDIWKEAGSQGLFGLDIPEEFGGMGADDYRFNAVAAEVINGFNAAVGSLLRHPQRRLPALHRRPRHPGAEGALAARDGRRRADLRHRDDRARRRLRPRRAEDHRGARRRRLGAQRQQDLHHQRLPGRPGHRRHPHRPEQGRQGHHLVHGRGGHGGLHPRPQARQGRPGGERHRRAVLRGRASARHQPDRRRGHGLHRDDAAPAAGAGRRRLRQRRPRQADPRSRPSSTPRSARRSASRSAPSSTTSSRSPSWSPRSRSPRPTSTTASRRTPRASSRRSTRPRPSGGAPRCRTTCSTSASSCTAATAS